MNAEFPRYIFEKYSNTGFNEYQFIRRRVVPCGRTDGYANMKKLIVAFRTLANELKVGNSKLLLFVAYLR